jgi:uncharacterized membrane protein YeiH
MIALHSLDLNLLQTLIEILATLAFGLSGLLEAARKKLDAVGVVVVAGLAAFGGGTIRDILLDRRPFFWMQHATWLWGLLALCVLAMFFMRARHFELTERAMLWPDAFGLGLFSASGTQVALSMQMPPLVAVMMGVITAIFGGVLRDIVCNEIPRAFKDHSPYAVCAFIGTWILVVAQPLGISEDLALISSAILVTLLRALSLIFGIELPAWDTTRLHKD